MRQSRTAVMMAAVLAASSFAGAATRHFEWSTKSPEARKMLGELQLRIENFQAGAENVELARKIVAADPTFAIGQYYFSAVQADPAQGEKEYLKAQEMAKTGTSEGEHRFIDAMAPVRVNQGTDFKKAIPALEALAKDYPDERLIQVVLGQLYNGDNQGAQALIAFQRAKAIGPKTARVEAFLAADDILKGNYGKARATYIEVQKTLPKDSVPAAVRFGITYSYLYEGHPDEALASLNTYLGEYKAGHLDQQFPEVFIWNAMARINLEYGRLDEAMRLYKKGYESVPGSSLAEDQKQIWLGRLHHGTARTLAKMGKQEEAWAEAETIKKMIEGGGEEGKQFWPSYHYVAGYLKLEAGDYPAALEHLKQANPNDPFHTMLLGRAYEKVGQKDEARKAYQRVVDSTQGGMERALAYPEAKKRLAAL